MDSERGGIVMQIVFKVREGQAEQGEEAAKSAAKSHLPDAMKDVSVRQLFPGLTTGQRARLFILELPEGVPDGKIKEVVSSLHKDEAIEYAEIPASKRPM